MDLVFVTLGLMVQVIFALKREWLLISEGLQSFDYRIILFALAYVLLSAEMFEPDRVVFLRIPLNGAHHILCDEHHLLHYVQIEARRYALDDGHLSF